MGEGSGSGSGWAALVFISLPVLRNGRFRARPGRGCAACLLCGPGREAESRGKMSTPSRSPSCAPWRRGLGRQPRVDWKSGSATCRQVTQPLGELTSRLSNGVTMPGRRWGLHGMRSFICHDWCSTGPAAASLAWAPTPGRSGSLARGPMSSLQPRSEAGSCHPHPAERAPSPAPRPEQESGEAEPGSRALEPALILLFSRCSARMPAFDVTLYAKHESLLLLDT